jgi:glutamate synthase domain-containing protein 2
VRRAAVPELHDPAAVTVPARAASATQTVAACRSQPAGTGAQAQRCSPVDGTDGGTAAAQSSSREATGRVAPVAVASR